MSFDTRGGRLRFKFCIIRSGEKFYILVEIKEDKEWWKVVLIVQMKAQV